MVQIRRLYDEYGVLTTRQIGDQFGVTPQNVSMIGLRKTWRHVPEEVA